MNKQEFIQSLWKRTCERLPKRTINCRILWWNADPYCKKWGMQGWAGIFPNPEQFYKFQDRVWMTTYLNKASQCTHWMWLPTPNQSYRQSKIEQIKDLWIDIQVRKPVVKKKGAYILWDEKYQTCGWATAETVDGVIDYFNKHIIKDNRTVKLTHWMPLVCPEF